MYKSGDLEGLSHIPAALGGQRQEFNVETNQLGIQSIPVCGWVSLTCRYCVFIKEPRACFISVHTRQSPLTTRLKPHLKIECRNIH